VRWLQVSPEPYSLSLSRVPEGIRVVVDAVREGAYLDGERLEARYGGVRQPLVQRGPGRYEAVLPVQPQGGQIAVYREGELIARRGASFPPAALDPTGARERLEALAQLTGGALIEAVADYRPPDAREPLPLWPVAALGALLAFLAELVMRRLGRLPQTESAPLGFSGARAPQP
jgi:hypothetical protein